MYSCPFHPQWCLSHKWGRDRWGSPHWRHTSNTAVAEAHLCLNTAHGCSHSSLVYKDTLLKKTKQKQNRNKNLSFKDLHFTSPLRVSSMLFCQPGFQGVRQPLVLFSFFMSIKNKHAGKLPFSSLSSLKWHVALVKPALTKAASTICKARGINSAHGRFPLHWSKLLLLKWWAVRSLLDSAKACREAGNCSPKQPAWVQLTGHQARYLLRKPGKPTSPRSAQMGTSQAVNLINTLLA